MAEKTDLEHSAVYGKIVEFFTQYFVERNLDKTISFLSDQIYSIGTGEGEIALTKDEFRLLLEKEFQELQGPIPFEIVDYKEKQRIENCWDCFLKMKVLLEMADQTKVHYYMRITIGLHQEGGQYIFDVFHASEASIHQEDGEFFPFKLIFNRVDAVNHKIKTDLLEIVKELIPGGVVGGYEEEGYPLYAANERFLKMVGYHSYSEFDKDIQGLIINSIHPEDREYVYQMLQYSFEHSNQYEIQYRMKKKDGTYIWVYDIGKRTMDSNGKSAIISVITDISEQILKKKKMEKEMSRDALTGLYNRKSGEERICSSLNGSQGYFFFMADIDNFKLVNDIYGHVQGDEVLRMFGKQVSQFFRRKDTICRIGGDEFVIFIQDTANMEAISAKMHYLIQEYKKMMDMKWPEANSTLSIGGVWSDKMYEFKELYKMADDVLYEVKKGKKGELKIRIM